MFDWHIWEKKSFNQILHEMPCTLSRLTLPSQTWSGKVSCNKLFVQKTCLLLLLFLLIWVSPYTNKAVLAMPCLCNFISHLTCLLLYILRCIRPTWKHQCALIDHNIFMKGIGSIVVILNHSGFFLSTFLYFGCFFEFLLRKTLF